MAVRITIDIFSGRPNPVVDLTGKQAQAALERLKPAEGIAADKRGRNGPPETCRDVSE